jgi:hypothetical protein
MNLSKTILIWNFEDAPKEYQSLSNNGGDEDWIAFIPESMKDEYIGWMDGGSFGCCCVDEHEVEGGIIRIGAHS